MFIVACFGVVVNLVLGTVFMEDHGGTLSAHGHSHDGHGCGHVELKDLDEIEMGHSHGHDSSHSHDSGHVPDSGNVHHVGCSHDHGHDNDHEHGHGHDSEVEHGHEHAHADHADEKTTLVRKDDVNSSHGSFDEGGGHAHSHGHDDGHGHDCAGHDHGEGTILEHGHSHEILAPYSEAAQTDVNIQAAYLHVITDTIQSIAVAIAGAIIWWQPNWQIVDPIATFIFSILVCYTTVPLLDRVMKIFMEGVPAHIGVYKYKYMNIYTHSRTHIYRTHSTDTYTYAHTLYRHTHFHTHAHTFIYICFFFFLHYSLF